MLGPEGTHSLFEETDIGQVGLYQNAVEAVDEWVRGVTKGEDVDVVVVPEGVQDVVDHVTGDFAPHPGHGTGAVH